MVAIPLFFIPVQRGDDKRGGDIVPPIPFFMKPSGMTLYMRGAVGRTMLMKHARCPLLVVSVKDNATPTGER
jgi:hypothetical protein